MPKSKTRKISIPGGSNVSVTEVSFDTIKENWDEYELSDGTLVRVKNVILKMFQQVDDEGNVVYNDEGDPAIIVMGHQIIVAGSPKD